MSESAKIRYTTATGYETTAYVEIEDGWATGTNKHTDEPMTARWDEAREQWLEVVGVSTGPGPLPDLPPRKGDQ